MSDDRIGLVMFVDDEHIDRMFAERAMKRSGRVDKTLSFACPQRALDHLRDPDRAPVDVIFLDVNMPAMDGIEFVDRAVAEFGPDFAGCVMVTLTVALPPAAEARFRRHDIVKGFLTKPITTDHVAFSAAALRQTAPAAHNAT